MISTIVNSPQRADKDRGEKRKHRLFFAARLGLFSLAAVLSAGILVLQPQRGLGSGEFLVGEPAPRSLFSPLQITYADQEATEEARAKKIESAPLVFSVDAKALKETRKKADRLFNALEEIKKSSKESRGAGSAILPVVISESSLKTLLEQPRPGDAPKELEMIFEKGLDRGILEEAAKKELLDRGISELTVLTGGGKESLNVPLRNIPNPEELRNSPERFLGETAKGRGLKAAVLDVFNALIVPDLFPDEQETKARRKKAAESVPPVQETIKKGELIVQRGMLITPGEKKRVDRIQKKLAEHEILNQFLAAGLLVFLTYFLCFIYLALFEKKTFASLRMTLIVLAAFLLTLLFSKLVLSLPNASAYWMPTALAPLVLILLTHSRLGILSAAAMAVLTAPLAGFAADAVLATLLTGVAATLAAVKLRKRLQIIKVGAAMGLTYFTVLFAFRMFQEVPVLEAFQTASQGLFNGLLITTPLSFFLVLPVMENLFDRTTDITLLELSDLNHPLLKRMIVEAPGTYHHSLVMSTLAESACEAIGANPLLARVGCYFHDIGKIARSEFFTENQTQKNLSKHEKLTPTISCLIIMNHVKEGIELGRRFKLKEPILRFIPEHHGTGVIYYFYKKALDAAKAGEKVDADDFRYPGPKPQSKETAVALLADSAEAASRSLKDPSPDGIRHLVRKIINDKFIDGQLDACDLTLKDLHKIQESFVHNLMAIFHTRVSYPAPPPDAPDRPDLFGEGQFSKFRQGTDVC